MTSRFKLPVLGLALAAMMTFAAGLSGEESKHPLMKDPGKVKETAPATFTAKFETSQGDIEFECVREWAPHGVDRFYNLAKMGFFNEIRFFRVIEGFMAQFGIHGNPEVSKRWAKNNLPADPVKKSNTRGMLTYAMAGSPTTRSTQLFINYGDNARLDKDGFAPICKVSKGMDVADKLYKKYGGKPSSFQGDIQSKGNAYLAETWPELDYIKTSSIIKEGEKVTITDKPKTSSGTSVNPDAEGEEKSDTSTYIIVGLLAAGALIAFMFTRGNRDEEEEPPRPRPSKKTATKKRSAKKTGTKKTGTKKTGTKKKRTKKAKKPPAD